MATLYDDFLPQVLPEVPGCPEISAINAVRKACIDFCNRSLIHVVDHDPVTVIANTADYDLESPVSETRVAKIMRCWFKLVELAPAHPDEIGDPTFYNQNIGGVELAPSDPRIFTQKDADTFSLFPIPALTEPQTVTLRVALTPTRKSAGCATFLFEDWVDEIAAGASSILQATPGKAYFNPAKSAFNRQQFEAGVNAAKQTATRGYVRASLRVQMRRI
jgi:hypothetical protein